MNFTSLSFQKGEKIPTKFTGEGADLSPELKWSEIPDETQELALICDDPDAPRAEPWVHWVVYGMEPSLKELPQDLPKVPHLNEPVHIDQGKNSFGKIGYGGPMPPSDDGVHHYIFRLYALDKKLYLEPGKTKEELLSAMKGHVLDQARLVGKYER